MIVELANQKQAATLHSALVQLRFPVTLATQHPRVIETQAPRKAVEDLAVRNALTIASMDVAAWED